MAYRTPLLLWMPGGEAIQHIRQTEPRTKAAIEKLLAAIIDGTVRAQLPRGAKRQIQSELLPKEALNFVPRGRFSPGASPVVLMGLSWTRTMWEAADIRADGTVGFGSETRWPFWVRRNDVTRLWPVAPAARQRERGAPISNGIREAIDHLWPRGIPAALIAKDRNNRIVEWLKANGLSVPAPTAVSNAVQRVLRDMKQQQRNKKRRQATAKRIS